MTAEWINDEHGIAIMLTQQEDGFHEADTIVIHPWQLRAVCERFGLVANDEQSAKTIATLTRRIKVLAHRINFLDDWLRNHSDSRHADLTYEWAYSGGTAELADEFCADFPDDEVDDDSTEVKPRGEVASPLATQLDLVTP